MDRLPIMLDYLKGADLAAVEMDMIAQLEQWDYFFNKETIQSVYYDIWFEKLYRSIWDEIATSNENNIALKYPLTGHTTLLNLNFTLAKFYFFNLLLLKLYLDIFLVSK